MVCCGGDAGCRCATTVLADTAETFTKAAADKTPAWRDVLVANPSSAGAAQAQLITNTEKKGLVFLRPITRLRIQL